MIINRLSEILGKKRMKMSEFSKLSCVNKNTILELYHGRAKRIDLDVLNRICKALNCKPGDILDFVPDEENNC